MPSDLPTVLANVNGYLFALGNDTVSIIAYTIGYVYALAIGDFFVKKIVTRMHEGLGEYRKDAIKGHNRVLGLVEAVLFVTSIQIERPDFIPVWLGLKAVAGWSHWNRISFTHYNDDGTWVTIYGRQSFNIFLAGSGLVISFSFIGSQLINWVRAYNVLPAITTAIGAAIAAVWLYLILPKPRPRLSPEK